MKFFILVILFAAWLQSMLKLTLVPRIYRWGILILSVLPVFFFRERLASSSFQSIGEFLSDPVNLRDFCALVVIQELLALLRADAHRTVRYVDGILRSWRSQGLTTVKAVRGKGALSPANILATGKQPAKQPAKDLFNRNWNAVFDDEETED